MVWIVMVIIAVVAILATPLRLRLRLASEARPVWGAELAWLGGLVCISRSARGKEGGRRKEWHSGIGATWRRSGRAERRAFVRMLREIWAATNFTIRGSLRYGCDDPAVTAWLHAAYCAARGAGYLPNLTAEPDFETAGWAGMAEAVWSVRPSGLVMPVGRFLLLCACRRVGKIITGGRGRWQVQT